MDFKTLSKNLTTITGNTSLGEYIAVQLVKLLILQMILNIIGNATNRVLAGDMNIDTIKCENVGTMNDLTTLLSYPYSPIFNITYEDI